MHNLHQPISISGCTVHANDLNPNSYKYLMTNAALNKIQNKIKGYNLDARVFFRHVVCKRHQFTHVLMNLPACAIEFLDVFRGAYAAANAVNALPLDANKENTVLPKVHCYCFAKTDVNVDTFNTNTNTPGGGNPNKKNFKAARLEILRHDVLRRAEVALGMPGIVILMIHVLALTLARNWFFVFQSATHFVGFFVGVNLTPPLVIEVHRVGSKYLHS